MPEQSTEFFTTCGRIEAEPFTARKHTRSASVSDNGCTFVCEKSAFLTCENSPEVGGRLAAFAFLIPQPSGAWVA